MAAKRGGKEKRAVRRLERQVAKKNRPPAQPDGYPQGKHLGGLGKKDRVCFCGGCFERNDGPRNFIMGA